MYLKLKISNYPTACILQGVFSLLIAVCLALGVIWVRQDSASIARHLSEVEKEISQTDQNLNYLRDKVADLETPANLIKYVEGDLKPAEERQIIWLRSGNRFSDKATGKELEPFALSFELAFIGRTSRP